MKQSRSAPPIGLPGEQQQAREKRARLRQRVLNALLAVVGWAALVIVIGPTRAPLELPPLGPAEREMVSLRDFVDHEPVADLAVQQEQAAALVPLRYSFDADAVTRRIDSVHAAFRLVRPKLRLYVKDRERLLAEIGQKETLLSDVHPAKKGAVAPAAVDGAIPAGVHDLDVAFDDELERVRPEFEALLARRRSEINSEVFPALRKAGFAEDVELLLTDVVQVLLSQRIVRDQDRFEDDLTRGVVEEKTDLRYDRASARGKVGDVDDTQKQAEEFVAECVKQKKPSKFDENVLQSAIKALARSMVEPTFQRDMAATHQAEQIARDAVPKTREVRFARGQSLIKRGDLVTPSLQERMQRMQQGLGDDQTPRSYAATALFLAIALGLFVGFASRNLHHFRYRPRDAHLLAAILLVHAVVLRGTVGLGHLLVAPGGAINPVMWMVALPYALGPTLATLFLRPFTAAPFSLLCAVAAAIMAHNSSFLHLYPNLDALITVQALVAGLAGVHAARHFRQRADLAKGAVTISVIGALSAASIALFTAPTATDLFDTHNGLVVLMGGASGIVCYLLLAALTPLFESMFNRLTDIKLLELASMNHPALRQLATETPGTFTHSVMVGNLAQAGCDAIGANGLLARVGAYYHDLGKTKNPRYFAENQSGDNPHDRLKPHLSALIIKAHVKDGIKILKEFRLPDEIIDFVPQHHGTSLIAHFYHRAARDALDTGEDVNEADFRYPGPKPQRKETAMLMLADAVEAAAKALPEPNPMRVQGLVKKIIAGKLEDGQFDQCDLTLRELALIEQAFVKAVVGIHHTRPVYQPPVQEQLALELKARDNGDDVKRLAAMADGGVGARNRVFRDTLNFAPPIARTDQFAKSVANAPTTQQLALQTGQGEPTHVDPEGAAPIAPTAIVSSVSGAHVPGSGV